MGAVVVSVVVVGACIGVGMWLALGERSEEIATAPAQRPRAPRVRRPARVASPVLVRPARAEVARPTRWWVRVRSAVALAFLSTALGVATAVGVGVVVVVLLGLLRASIG